MHHGTKIALFLVLGSLPFSSEFVCMLQQPSATVNSIGMKMVRIEPGTFQMGSVAEGDFDERPVHKVRISQPFFMSATEVTNAQYEQFDPDHKKLRGKYGISSADDDPVVFVSWSDAMRFCQWLTKKENRTGQVYRLPTEAEWEYACRAGTTTAFSVGDTLDRTLSNSDKPRRAGSTAANPWGLHEMHGNVEEWCLDWYGPYSEHDQVDPIGMVKGDFRVIRGGGYATRAEFLRSANRQGSLPEDRSRLIGFRIVLAAELKSKPLPMPPVPRWGQNVSQRRHDWNDGPDANQPYFRGPTSYVHIPADSNGPLFSRHNHQPAITACPNGDLLAIWYSCNNEPGRELAVVASRLRHGSDQWEPAAPFWDAPDRNDHGNALLWDGEKTLYHFNGLAVDQGWGELALVMRTSKDNGATWSSARLISPEHKFHHQVIEGAFRTKEGILIVPCDAVPGGNGGSVIHLSKDGGSSWIHPAADRQAPRFAEGQTGAWIAGIHAGVAQLKDGSLLAFGRGDSINGRMPKSISTDLGKAWQYSASEFPPIGSGQRLILERLREGPLLFVSFTPRLDLTFADGQTRTVKGLFAAVSYDEGKTWPVKKLITPGGPARTMDGGGNTGKFTMSAITAEPRGYLSCTQAPDGVIHLISSRLHYAFNLKWLETPPQPN